MSQSVKSNAISDLGVTRMTVLIDFVLCLSRAGCARHGPGTKDDNSVLMTLSPVRLLLI